jgi:hypothetical protein
MFDPDFLVPFLVLSVPIVAIVGGIVAGIVRSAGQQRMLELAQRERIAALERGMDPDKLPPFPRIAQELGSLGRTPYEAAKHRAQGLVIGGLVTLFGGIGLLVFLILMQPNDNVWGVGLIPIMVGGALLLSAWIVWPRNGAGKS